MIDNIQSRELELGKAAEHLVCADLILSGYRAFLSDQGLPYDIVVDLAGKLIRIQVKGTMAHRPLPKNKGGAGPRYMWHVRRSGKGFSRIIGNDQFDILALVALDIKTTAYIPIDDKIRQTVHLRPPGIDFISVSSKCVNKRIDEYPFSDAIAGL